MKRLLFIVILTMSFGVGAEYHYRQVMPGVKRQRKVRANPGISSPFSLIKQKRPERLSQPPVSQLEEFLLDTNRIFGPAPGNQEFADVSFDGTNYFAVWNDWSNYSIYGARISQEGVLLDTFGIPICTNWAAQNPVVAFDGTNYLVVWEDWRNPDGDIYGARVTPAGVVLDPDGMAISTAEYDQFVPAIAFDGTNYLVAWNDCRNGWEYDIYAARVTPAGEVLEPDGIAVSTAPYDQFIFRGIGFDGTNYLLVWHDDRDGDGYYDVYGARVTKAGVVLDTAGFAVAAAQNNQGFAQVGFDGTHYLVVWLDDRTTEEDYHIYGARVTTTGDVVDTNGIEITQYLSTYPALDFDGTNYLVVWTDLRSGYEADIYAARVSTAGEVLDTNGIIVSSAEADQFLPAIVFDGTRYFTVWSDYRNNYEDIYGSRVTTAGEVLDPDGVLLDYGYSSPEQYAPAVSFDGTNYLVVWRDYRNGDPHIYGTRVTNEGLVLDPQGIQISAGTGWQDAPAVAFDGTNYLVVWDEWRDGEADIYGARVTPDGEVLDPDGIPISTAESWQYLPAVGFDGTNYLVVWGDERAGMPDIYGARVDTAGEVIDTSGIAISTADNEQYFPALAFDGTNYLVVWNDYRSGEYYDIYGTRVTTTGNVLEPQGIAISTADFDQRYPRVAYDGTNYLVVFNDDRDGDWFTDIYGARVTATGKVLDTLGIAISTADLDQSDPAVAFFGNYAVVWTDYRNEWDGDIYGARVTPDGEVLDPDGIELINQPEARYSPDIVIGSGSQVFLVFGGFVPLYGVSKIFGAFWYPVGITENSGLKKNGSGLRLLTNPIRENGTVELTLIKESEIKLDLLDVSGRLVRTVVRGRFSSGSHQIRFDTQNLQAGIYFLRCTTKEKGLITRVTNIR